MSLSGVMVLLLGRESWKGVGRRLAEGKWGSEEHEDENVAGSVRCFVSSGDGLDGGALLPLAAGESYEVHDAKSSGGPSGGVRSEVSASKRVVAVADAA